MPFTPSHDPTPKFFHLLHPHLCTTPVQNVKICLCLHQEVDTGRVRKYVVKSLLHLSASELWYKQSNNGLKIIWNNITVIPIRESQLYTYYHIVACGSKHCIYVLPNTRSVPVINAIFCQLRNKRGRKCFSRTAGMSGLGWIPGLQSYFFARLVLSWPVSHPPMRS